MKKTIKESNLKKLTLKRGISLITLVITIVIIIILAAAVILSLNNNNLISNANKATVKNDISETEDAYSIYIGELIVEELDNVQGTGVIGKTSSDFVTVTGAGIKEKRDITLSDIGIDSNNIQEISIADNTIVGIKWKNKYYNKNGIVVTEEEYVNLMPEKLGEGTRDKTEAAYNVPYVPEGFSYKEGTVSTGYVIQDALENEFVWIPVDGETVKYEKNEETSLTDGSLPVGVTSEETQIENYQGFYIARYEAGIPDSMSAPAEVEGVPVSKKGAIVWTDIYNYIEQNAESMVNTDYVKSGLITGTMWDAVMDYLYDDGNGVNVGWSTDWGNYSESTGNAAIVENGEAKYGTVQTAGYSDYWSYKGIYDIAGNASEYTNEFAGTKMIIRGGGIFENGASARETFPTRLWANSGCGFRVALYIM